MKTRPIIFNAEMVRATLDGRKTQTRRPIKNIAVGPGGWPSFTAGRHHGNLVKPKYCPHGEPGDRLWVRETWAIKRTNIENYGSAYPGLAADACVKLSDGRVVPQWGVEQVYRADGDFDPTKTTYTNGTRGRWRPSIHMPRWASRITLEITDVRVERVQEISRDDAYSEGVVRHSGDLLDHFMGRKRGNPIAAFSQGWDSICLERGYGWDSNCWVWCLTFKLLTAGAGSGETKTKTGESDGNESR